MKKIFGILVLLLFVKIVVAQNRKFKIGDRYGGGIIAYILQSGDPGYDVSIQHGLIAAPSDQGKFQWCSKSRFIETRWELGAGSANTRNIVSQCGNGTAAIACQDLILGGFSDWYLPSKDELKKLYLNRNSIGGFTKEKNEVYWSSTQTNVLDAWALYFNDGFQYNGGKNLTANVRAVRSF